MDTFEYYWIYYFMLKGESLLEYANLFSLNTSLLDYTKSFSPNKYEQDDKITLKYFQ